MEIKAE